VRHAILDDVVSIVALFERLSLEERRRRFFSAFHPDARFVETMVRLSERGGAMLVAEARPPDGAAGSPIVVGEAEIAPLPDGDAVLGITVDPSWRGWLAPYLLDALAEVADHMGFWNLRAAILADNRPMFALIQARGYATHDTDDRTTIDAVIAATGGTPCWPPAHERPRVLVEVPGARWRATPALRAAGVDVRACPGPGSRGASRCPLLAGEPCPLVEGADIVVFSFREDDTRGRALLDAHRARGTRCLVIDARRGEHPTGGPDDAVVLEAPTDAEIRAVVEALLGSGEAVEVSPSAG